VRGSKKITRSILGAILLTMALGFASPSPTLAATTHLDEMADLDEMLTFAAANNPGLEAALHRWRAALEKIPQAGALPDPQFSYSYWVNEVETRVGPQRQKFKLNQTLPGFGKLDLKENAAVRAAESERYRYEAAARRLFLEVKVAYYELAYLFRAIEVSEESLSLLSKLENVVRTRYRASKATHSDLIRAQLERSMLADRLASLRDLRHPLEARLNAALGRSSEALLPRPMILTTSSLELGEQELLDNLLRTNPDLQSLGREMERQRFLVELAGKQSQPDFNIGFEFMETGPTLMPDVQDSGKDPFAVMVSLNLPLWRGKYRAAESESVLRSLVIDRTIHDRANTLSVHLKEALYDYRDGERKALLYRDNLIPQGRQAFEVTEQAYIAGKLEFTNLVDAQRVLLEFQLSHERALADCAKSLAKIEMLAGVPDERTK
jgi:outer membrane protein, heavy metal efflux system